MSHFDFTIFSPKSLRIRWNIICATLWGNVKELNILANALLCLFAFFLFWLEIILILDQILGYKISWLQPIFLTWKSSDFSSYSLIENQLISARIIAGNSADFSSYYWLENQLISARILELKISWFQLIFLDKKISWF